MLSVAVPVERHNLIGGNMFGGLHVELREGFVKSTLTTCA